MGRNLVFAPVLQISALNNCLNVHFPHPFYFQGEFHPFWEMVYAVDGPFRVAGNDRVYTMQKGDVIFHKPMEFHRLWSVEGKDVRAYIIGFCGSGTLLDQLEGGAFELNEEQQCQLEEVMRYAGEQFSLRYNYGENYLAVMERHPEKAVQIQCYVERLKLFLLSLGQEDVHLKVKEHSDSEDSCIFRSTVQMLTEHINDWIDAEEIARELCCSSTRVKRVFAKYSDIGVHKYLLKIKMAEAINLLRSGLTCIEVSRRMGFSSQNYFSTVFKRETGYPPSYYTRQKGYEFPVDDAHKGMRIHGGGGRRKTAGQIGVSDWV